MQFKISVSGIPPLLALVIFDWLLGDPRLGNRLDLLAVALLLIDHWNRGKS